LQVGAWSTKMEGKESLLARGPAPLDHHSKHTLNTDTTSTLPQ
jgi:hypothetical protein